ncbi:hypothetical protein [Cedecea lapagei]|uniref:hypothetical protein n=1 Tax=Cedecea lapagei TaxID=158823 RepID=UPI001BD17AE9|nr:hypothetical protein [Cedecea lapagei]
MSLSYVEFGKVDLSDVFFDSLKNDYPAFESWFKKKGSEKAYVSYDDAGKIDGFLYLKIENEELNDMTPSFPMKKRLKCGTFKIDARGTKMGERFVRKIFDFAMPHDIDEVYVTIFDKHQGLIGLLERYGFRLLSRKNLETENGCEGVYFKDFNWKQTLAYDNYPMIKMNDRNYLLAIKPEFHSKLFPESILNNENDLILEDVTYTNSIHKIYIGAMRGMEDLQPGDNVIIYRTSDGVGLAKYRSVVTSVCTLQEYKNIKEFSSFNDFKSYCGGASIFSDEELLGYYNKKYPSHVIKLTYDFPLRKRIIRDELLSILGYTPNYSGFFKLSDVHFKAVLNAGKVNENFIVD